MKTSTWCVFVLVAWPLRLPEEWPEACGSLTVVGARTMHGLALSQLRIQQSDLRKAWIRSINLHIVVQYAINLSHSTNLCQHVIVWCYELMFTFHQRGPVAVAGDQFQCLSCQSLSVVYIFFTRQAVNTGWQEIDFHGCLRQLARAKSMDEYDVTMQVPHFCLTSQINCGDVTMLSQKGPSLATRAESAIDNCF